MADKEDLRGFASDYRKNGSTKYPYLQNFLFRFACEIEDRLQTIETRIKRIEEEFMEHLANEHNVLITQSKKNENDRTQRPGRTEVD